MKKLRMTVNTLDKVGKINKEIYGHFLEQTGKIIYDGIFVGKDSKIPNKGGVRSDVIEAYREINVPLLHWPGGGFADSYHWMDGIGEQSQRKRTFNIQDRKVYDNSFGTHEFFDLCEELGCEAYIVCNVGTGSPQESADWIEYITSSADTTMTRLRRKNGREKPWDLKFVCMGNEWWFFESAEKYASDYKQHSFFSSRSGGNVKHKLLRGPQSYDYRRTSELADAVDEGTFDAMTAYHIVSPLRGPQSHATDFTDDEHYSIMRNVISIDESMTRHLGILKKRDRNQKVRLAIDEWGTWHKQENADVLWRHQITMRDAIAAATELNIFNKRCNDLLLCSLCISVNALASIILTEGERMLKTPIFHVFKMYKEHQDATLINSFLEQDIIFPESAPLPAVSHSVSIKENHMLITLANCSLENDYEIDADILYEDYVLDSAEILSSDIRAHNTFDDPDHVRSEEYSAITHKNGRLIIRLPHTSVVSVKLIKK